MSTRQPVQTKAKQDLQTEQIQKQLLENLTLEEILDFIQQLSQKALENNKTQRDPAQKNTLPPHIRQGIKESLEEYEQGNYVVLEPGEEMTMENIRQKFKMKCYN